MFRVLNTDNKWNEAVAVCLSEHIHGPLVKSYFCNHILRITVQVNPRAPYHMSVSLQHYITSIHAL